MMIPINNKQLLEAAEILRDKAKEIFDYKIRQADSAAAVVVYLDEQVAKIKQEIKDDERRKEESIEVTKVSGEIPTITDWSSKEEENADQKKSISKKEPERYFNKFKVREQ